MSKKCAGSQKIKDLLSDYNLEVPISSSIVMPNKKDLNYCPKCGGRDLSAIFRIPVNIDNSISIESEDAISKCDSCKYEDIYGNFEKTNKQQERNSKIDSILYGIQ